MAERSISPRRLRERPLPHVVFALVCAAHIAHIVYADRSHAFATDSSGYMNSAKLLRQGRIRATARPIPGVDLARFDPWYFAPVAFNVAERGRTLVPQYPVGYPLHLAAFSVFGWQFSGVVLHCLATVATLLACYLIGWRLGLSFRWSVGVVIALALCPNYVFSFKEVMSDSLATAWCSVAVLLALGASWRPRLAVGAGVAVGIAVLVRPANVLIFPAVLIALPPTWRARLTFALAGAPLAILLGAYQHLLHGNIATTGYGDMSAEFQLAYVLPRVQFFTAWTSLYLGPAVLIGLPVTFVGAAFGDRGLRLLAAWIASFFTFYAFYYSALNPDVVEDSLRFVLPAYPAVFLGCGLACKRAYAEAMLRWRGRRFSRRLVKAALALVIVTPLITEPVLGVAHSAYRRVGREPRDAARWLAGRVPEGAVITAAQASGEVFFYTSLPLINAQHVALRDRLAFARIVCAARAPVYAYVVDTEVRMLAWYTGYEWKPVDRFRGYQLLELGPDRCSKVGGSGG